MQVWASRCKSFTLRELRLLEPQLHRTSPISCLSGASALRHQAHRDLTSPLHLNQVANAGSSGWAIRWVWCRETSISDSPR